MEINKLRVFVSVIETQNFTRTAQNLHLSQPSVSYIIKAIEDEVGQQLFIRNKRRVVPTKNGLIFYNQIKPLINKYYLALQSIQINETQEANIINIGCAVTPYHIKTIPDWIKKFSLKYPKVKFNVTILDHNKLKQYLENEDIDIFLTSEGDAKDLKGTTFYPLITDQFFALVPQNNPLASKRQLTFTDFDRQSLIFIDNNIAGVELIRLQNKVKNTCQTLNITYTNDIASALILVNALQGITFGLNFIYTGLNEALTQVPLRTSPEVIYGAVINSHNERKIVKEFIKFIQNEV